MKKLVIILAIAIMLFATLKQRTEQPTTAAVGASPNAATRSPEELPETHTEQETPLKECTEETKGAEPEETVECVDKGDQALAEYKPQSGNQPNPFESAPPAEIVDHPVEDIVGEGEDRPGEGKHF